MLPDDRLRPITDYTETDAFLPENIDVEVMQDILNVSISQFILSDTIQKQIKTANLPFKYIPFMQSIQSLALLPQ